MAGTAPNKILKSLLTIFGLAPHEVLSQVMTSRRSSGESLEGNSGAMASQWAAATSTPMSQQRITKYTDYDGMDGFSDVSIALDVYPEEATIEDHVEKRTVWATGDPEVVEVVHDLLDRLGIEDKIFGMARHLSKYGDMFAYLMAEGSEGVTQIVIPHPSAVTRIDDPISQKLKGFKYSEIQSLHPETDTDQGISDLGGHLGTLQDTPLDPWEVVHWMIPGSNLRTHYGYSMIEPARRAWRALEMLETAMAIYRLHRAGLRLIYYVDVGTGPADEAEDIIQEYKRRLKDRSYLRVKDQAEAGGRDPDFADYLSKYNPLNLLDDIFWPIREGSNSKVDVLHADADVRGVADVDYFHNKLRTALNIPKAYFDGDISGWGANKALAQQDVRFAKKIMRLKRALVRGFERLCAIHLTLMGLDGETADFQIHMSDSSGLFEEQRLQTAASKLNQSISMMGAAAAFGLDKRKWARKILRDYLDFSDADIRKYQTEEFPDPIQTAPDNKAGGKAKSPDADPAAGKGDPEEDAEDPKGKKDERWGIAGDDAEILASLRAKLRGKDLSEQAKEVLQPFRRLHDEEEDLPDLANGG